MLKGHLPRVIHITEYLLIKEENLRCQKVIWTGWGLQGGVAVLVLGAHRELLLHQEFDHFRVPLHLRIVEGSQKDGRRVGEGS